MGARDIRQAGAENGGDFEGDVTLTGGVSLFYESADLLMAPFS